MLQKRPLKAIKDEADEKDERQLVGVPPKFDTVGACEFVGRVGKQLEELLKQTDLN